MNAALCARTRIHNPQIQVLSILARVLVVVIARAAHVLTRPFDLIGRWLAVARPSAAASGFSLVVKSQEVPADSVIDKLREALALIERHDPRRLHRVRRDVPRVVALDLLLLGGTQWMHPRAILLKAAAVHQQPPLWAAGVIIHEATHIRLKQRGIRTTPLNRARVERCCVREQIHFLQRAGAQDPLYGAEAGYYIDWLEQSLNAPTPWYTLENKWLRAREALVAESAPRWVLWLVDALRPSRVEGARDGGA